MCRIHCSPAPRTCVPPSLARVCRQPHGIGSTDGSGPSLRLAAPVFGRFQSPHGRAPLGNAPSSPGSDGTGNSPRSRNRQSTPGGSARSADRAPTRWSLQLPSPVSLCLPAFRRFPSRPVAPGCAPIGPPLLHPESVSIGCSLLLSPRVREPSCTTRPLLDSDAKSAPSARQRQRGWKSGPCRLDDFAQLQPVSLRRPELSLPVPLVQLSSDRRQ